MTTVILTVLDYPNDNLTFVAEPEYLELHNISPEYMTSNDILHILGGVDTCGDNHYLGELEVRYFDGASFVVRHQDTQIVGCVNFSK